jgi:exopolysaccharide biosynthesis polyprenyl glycosylphosphotransferase
MYGEKMVKEKSGGLRFGIAERRTMLVFGDLIVSILALSISLVIWATSTGEWLGFTLAFFQERVALWVYLMPLMWLFLLVESYDLTRSANWQKTAQGIASAASLGFLLYLIVYFASKNPLPRIGVASFLVAASGLTLIWRLVYIRIFTRLKYMRRVLLVGAGKAGKTILDVIVSLDPTPFNLVGIIDDDPEKIGTELNGFQVIGSSESLNAIINHENVTDIIVAISGEISGVAFQALLDAQHSGVEITRMPVAYEQLLNRVPIQILEADWILRSFVDQFRSNRLYALSKRGMDILGGLAGILVLGAILPFVALGILLESGFPIFYTQVRLGVGGRSFKIIKFRTMRKDAEVDGKPLLATEDDERATRFGKILRRTHIDEIPQVINVLRGDMSLVGPRSERPSLVDHYVRRIPFYRSRLLVKPGITGWAQVNYGYAGSVEETIIKLEYDLYYIKHRNLILDFLTILRTPGTMLGMRGL